MPPTHFDIEAEQLQRLRALIAELAPRNRFYGAKLERASLNADVASLAEFSARLPLTTKAELVEDRRAHPPYGSNLTYPLEAYTRFNQTSATSGAPLVWLDTWEDWEQQLEHWEQVFGAAGVTAKDCVYFAFSFGPFLGFWTAYEAASRLRCLCIPGGGQTTAARLRAILEHSATVLCCTPTYAIHLAQTAAGEGIDLSKSCVRAIIVAGEPGAGIPATRAQIENLWPGARVSDHHGMTEVGPVSYECPATPGVLHVIESSYYAEVLDSATGQPAPPGEVGELILTTLLRPGMPLLRYRTGDLVRPAAPGACGCGRRELALAGGILGRADDMVIVRGSNVYPTAVEAAVRQFADVAEYRVEIDERGALTELKVQIEPAPQCADPPALAAQVENELRRVLGLRVPVELTPQGALPRFELKARRWVRLQS